MSSNLDTYSRRNCVLAGYHGDPFGCLAPRFKRPWIEFDPATHSTRSVEWIASAEAAATKIKRWLRDSLERHLLLRIEKERVWQLKVSATIEADRVQEEVEDLFADFDYYYNNEGDY
jgi:hypothetical protein